MITKNDVAVWKGPLNNLAEQVYQNAKDHGFWDKERNFGEMMMLAVSELSEALEEDRAGNPDVYFRHMSDCGSVTGMNYALDEAGVECTCTPKPEGVVTELADCIIRCLDTMRSRNVDIDEIVRLKMEYNASRPHKHGKRY